MNDRVLFLYLITRTDEAGWGECRQFVAACYSGAEALAILPSGGIGGELFWAKPECRKGKCIGTAGRGVRPGIIIADWREG